MKLVYFPERKQSINVESITHIDWGYSSDGRVVCVGLQSGDSMYFYQRTKDYDLLIEAISVESTEQGAIPKPDTFQDVPH